MTTRFAVAAASALAVIVSLAGCSTTATTATAPTATHSNASASSSPVNPLAGTWQTAAIPSATWEATYRHAGATTAEVAQFRTGMGKTFTVSLRFSGTDWVQFQQTDDQAPEEGSAGTYTLSGSTLTLAGCPFVFTTTLSGDTLSLRMLSSAAALSSCSRDDLLHVPMLWGTAAFQRTG